MLHVRYYGYRGALSDGSKYLFNALGALSTRGALCDNAGEAAYRKDFGAMNMNDPMDLLNADHIINWGKDLSRSSIHLAEIVKKARKQGCKVTTISPGCDGNDTLSDFTIRIKPGKDRFLAAAVIKEILDHGLSDAYSMSRASGLDSFMEILSGNSQEELLRACDCTRRDLEHLVKVFTKTDLTKTDLTKADLTKTDKRDSPEKRDHVKMPGNFSNPFKQAVAIIMGWGIQRYHFGGENVRYINALSFLAGNVGIPGGGTYFNISSSRNINSDWVSKAGKPCKTLLLPRIGTEILNADPPIQFLLADGSNFVNQAPDAATTIRAMDQIPFKVVVDAFMTDTAARADVILPCALNYERDEIVGSCLHNYVNHSAALFTPLGEARCDFDIMSDLAMRLDIPFPNKEEVMEKALQTKPIEKTFVENPINTTAMQELKERGFIKASYPKIAWKNLQFDHPNGKYRLPDALNRDPDAPDGYPMHLLSLVNRDFIHSQIPEESQTGLPDVYINPDSPHLTHLSQLSQLKDAKSDKTEPDMKKIHKTKCDKINPVYLATPIGRMQVQLKYVENMHPMTLIIRRGGWIKYGRCVNILIEPAITDMGENAAYYSQYARLES